MVKTFDGFASTIRRLRELVRSRLPEFSALILFVSVGALGWLIWEYRRTVDLVVHTVEVEAGILELFSSVHDAESGSGSFVLTGDDLYLQLYRRAVDKMGAKTLELQHLTNDNPEQQRNFLNLKAAMNESFIALEKAIDLRRTGGIDAAIAFMRIGGSYQALERVRAKISQMSATEGILYRSRVVNVQWVSVAGVLAASIALLIVIGSMVIWIQTTRREARDLLTTLAEREKNEAQIRQMQKMEAVGQLTGGLAHDFNNMLAVVIGGLNLTQKRLAAGDTDVEKFINAAMDGATRAATLTNRLMAFSRQLPLAPQPLDANRLITGMLELLQRSLSETVQTKTVLSLGLWSASVDEGQLENAILNLSINARDAMPGGGKLILETANFESDKAYALQHDLPEGQYVLISVTDTGEGMSHEVAAKAFDPFFTTKEVGKGTGLGLSQVYGFIKQSGGHIKIYSEPGHGTTVKMYFPRLPDVPGKVKTSTVELLPLPELQKQNSGQLILVVEDDARVRDMSVSSLRELGYTVIHANGAKNGLEKLTANPGTTLLFTDIVMPEINGRQLAAEVLRRRPDMKVLYTTGFARDAILQSETLDAGLHLITKPFTLAQLAAKMSIVLAESPAHQA